jgi:MoaA/NifB/PqqE/SkfB family radical SAM enzyme
MFFREINSSDKYMDYPIVTYPGYHQRRIGCLGAGNRYLYIDSVGNIHACPFCQRIAGNAVNDRLEDAVSVLREYGCQKYEMNTDR